MLTRHNINAALERTSGFVKSQIFFPLQHLLCASLAAGALASPIPKDAKPADLGLVGAGEGPAWETAGFLYFTGQDRITRRDGQGKTEIFRAPAGGANGLLFDHAGRLVVCESSQRRITRTEQDGTITVLADRYQGRRFNSPNDLSIDSKGRIYFSDPRYGKRDGMEMMDARGQAVEGVYRIDAPGSVTRILTHEVERPNGLLVGPGDKFLYVADNNNNQLNGARKLWRFSLKADGSIDPERRKLIFDWGAGRGPDGLKMDRQGHLYVAAGLNKPNPPYETKVPFTGGIYVLSSKGKRIDFIPIPDDEVTNCAFGEDDLKTLFITAGGHLWSIRLKVAGRRIADRRN